MKRIYLIRHGDKAPGTYYNEGMKCQDPPLSRLGLKQAGLIARRLKRYKIDELYASDHVRVLQTVKIIARRVRVTPVIEPAFREINLGDHELYTDKEYFDKFHEERKPYYLNKTDITCPGGEAYADVLDRVLPVFRCILAEQTHNNVCIVTSGGVIRILLCWIWQADMAARFGIGDPPECCGLTLLHYYPEIERLAVHCFNDYSHLE